MQAGFTEREQRVSRAIVAVATTWFALVAAWEMFGPILAGHYASSASMGIIAENMHRWGVAGPVWSYTATRPTADLYYCHHPWGIFYTTRFFYEVFGRHDFVCRLPAVVLSALTPPLLASVARAMWRPYAGAATAVGFVVLPISLSFASFNALEVPVIAWSALFLRGYVSFSVRPRRRSLALALGGAFMAMQADWPAYVLVAGVLGIELGRALLSHRRSNAAAERRRALFFMLLAALSALTLGSYLFLFARLGKLGDLSSSYAMRSAGSQASLGSLLKERRYWIELMFTPIAVAIGKAFALVACLRIALLRRSIEALPLAVLAMAIVQYVVFKQGADIHVFWPHYFAMYFALAMGGWVATLVPLLERLLADRAPGLAPRAHHLALAIALVPLALVLRDGVEVVAYARATGGRFNERGGRIESDGDKIALLEWLAPRHETIGLHASMNPNWAEVWALGGRPVDLAAPLPVAPGAVTVADARFLPDATRTQWLESHSVMAVGPYWVISEGEDAPSALSFVETEPSLMTRYFVSDSEPRRTVTPDAWATWELANHYGQTVEPPGSDPSTPEQHRIAHNARLEAGDASGAESELAPAEENCRPIHARFSDGTEILCARFKKGVAPELTLLFVPGKPLVAGVELSVASRVTSGPRFSSTMADPVVRESSFPFTLAPSRMRPGFVYSHTVTIRGRPGEEVFLASFNGRGAPAAPGPVEVLRY